MLRSGFTAQLMTLAAPFFVLRNVAVMTDSLLNSLQQQPDEGILTGDHLAQPQQGLAVSSQSTVHFGPHQSRVKGGDSDSRVLQTPLQSKCCHDL